MDQEKLLNNNRGLRELLYYCARTYGKEMNLEFPAKLMLEVASKDIYTTLECLGDPENIQDDDTVILTVWTEEL